MKTSQTTSSTRVIRHEGSDLNSFLIFFLDLYYMILISSTVYIYISRMKLSLNQRNILNKLNYSLNRSSNSYNSYRSYNRSYSYNTYSGRSYSLRSSNR
jgi:hypothetical protein